MTRVTVQDLRASRLCFQGARPWFARHGLDWPQFLAHGLDAEVLVQTGDALALRVIAIAEAREALDAGKAVRDG